jgi:hypothetical protein
MKLTGTILFLFIGLLMCAQTPIPFRKGDKWGLCDESKRVILQYQYDSIGLFSACGLAVVKQKQKFGFIDCMGKLVIPCKFEYATGFTGKKCVARVKENGKEFSIDTTGKNLTIEKTAKEDCDNCGELAQAPPGSNVLKNGKVGYACNAAAATVPAVYEAINPCPYLVEGNPLLQAQLHGKSGVIDCSNRTIIPFNYKTLLQTLCKTEGASRIYFVASNDSLFGLLDGTGKTVLAFKYAYLELMEDGFSKVRTTDGKWGYVALNGIEYFED